MRTSQPSGGGREQFGRRLRDGLRKGISEAHILCNCARSVINWPTSFSSSTKTNCVMARSGYTEQLLMEIALNWSLLLGSWFCAVILWDARQAEEFSLHHYKLWGLGTEISPHVSDEADTSAIRRGWSCSKPGRGRVCSFAGPSLHHVNGPSPRWEQGQESASVLLLLPGMAQKGKGRGCLHDTLRHLQSIVSCPPSGNATGLKLRGKVSVIHAEGCRFNSWYCQLGQRIIPIWDPGV